MHGDDGVACQDREPRLPPSSGPCIKARHMATVSLNSRYGSELNLI